MIINGQTLIENEKIPPIRSIENVTFKHNFSGGGAASCSMYVEYIKCSVLTDAAAPSGPEVTADDRTNTISGLNPDTMEYAVSIDGGVTYGAYTTASAPNLAGSKVVKVRIKAQGTSPASTDTVLTFTPDAGDVSGDGVINVADVIMTAEIAVESPGYSDAQKSRANVSDKADSTVDIADVVMISERTVDGTVTFPVDLP